MLNKARNDNRPFSELLQYFAMERFLFRLVNSPHADKFVLKGALMLWVWKSPISRATMDIDMLARHTSNEIEQVLVQIKDICVISAEEDGLQFDQTVSMVNRSPKMQIMKESASVLSLSWTGPGLTCKLM